jgi:hypothetical protein
VRGGGREALPGAPQPNPPRPRALPRRRRPFDPRPRGRRAARVRLAREARRGRRTLTLYVEPSMIDRPSTSATAAAACSCCRRVGAYTNTSPLSAAIRRAPVFASMSSRLAPWGRWGKGRGGFGGRVGLGGTTWGGGRGRGWRGFGAAEAAAACRRAGGLHAPPRASGHHLLAAARRQHIPHSHKRAHEDAAQAHARLDHASPRRGTQAAAHARAARAQTT